MLDIIFKKFILQKKMDKNINFSLSALEKISQIIGDRYSGSQITTFFKKVGYPNIIHDGTTKWRFVNTNLEEIQRKDSKLAIVKIIENLCNPEEFLGDAKRFQDITEIINEILSFYKLKVNNNGKVLYNENIEVNLKDKNNEKNIMFDSRKFHSEITKHGKQLFLEGRHFHSVFECCKAFDKYVREKSQIETKHGSELMSSALSLKGSLKLNTQQTETERNEQEGLMHLSMGLMKAVRNPESHEPELDWPLSIEDALDFLSLINVLYRKIDKCTYFIINN